MIPKYYKLSQARDITILLTDRIKLSDKRTIRIRHRDVFYLLSEERQRLLNPSTLADFAQLMKSTRPDIKASDDELIDSIRSRFIQQPSEIMAWSDYLNSEMKRLKESAESDSKKLSSLLKQHTETVEAEKSNKVESPSSGE